MYETAIIVAMIVGYLLGNSIDKKLEKDARDDMKHRDKMRKRFGSNSVSDKEILSEIRYKNSKTKEPTWKKWWRRNKSYQRQSD